MLLGACICLALNSKKKMLFALKKQFIELTLFNSHIQQS